VSADDDVGCRVLSLWKLRFDHWWWWNCPNFQTPSYHGHWWIFSDLHKAKIFTNGYLFADLFVQRVEMALMW